MMHAEHSESLESTVLAGFGISVIGFPLQVPFPYMFLRTPVRQSATRSQPKRFEVIPMRQFRIIYNVMALDT